MNLTRHFTAAALLALAPCLALAQNRAPDVLDEAVLSTLKRDNASLVCLCIFRRDLTTQPSAECRESGDLRTSAAC